MATDGKCHDPLELGGDGVDGYYPECDLKKGHVSDWHHSFDVRADTRYFEGKHAELDLMWRWVDDVPDQRSS